MKKRILSLVLVVALLFSMASVSLVSASAAADTTLYFEMPQHWIDQYGTTPGEKTTSVFCYVFTVGGSDPDFATPSWQSKSTKATYDDATGLYSFDVEGKYKQTLKDDADYCVIFSAKSTVTNANPQCYDLTFGTQCYGDTVYVTEKIYENPADSQKTANAAYWRNEENAAIYGPHAGITSMGVLQGEVYAPGEDKVAAVANFIASYPDNIITNPDPNVCVTLCGSVGVTPYEVYVKYEALYADAATEGLAPSLEQTAAWLGLSYPPEEPTEPTTEPATTVPTEPETTVPTEPETTVPTEPETTVPTEPETTVPTEPETTVPTEPETTVPTEPETTVPTEPETTVPTEPETTVPTEPETTVPTEPETTVPPTEPETTVPAAKFTVAGDCMTPAWDPSSNEMTNGSYEFNGVAYDYALTTDVEEGTWNFKVTNGTWDVAYPAQNFSFTVTDFGSVTIYFNSETHEIAVDGEYIDNSEFVVEVITAVGNGDGTWLNGANWDPTDVTNDMTEVAPGVWEITYENIDAYDSYEVKFAVNHAWTYNWTIDGIFDGQTNIGQVVEQDGSTVTLRIDINGFDFKTKEGTVVTAFEVTPPATEPETTVPTEPETTVPTEPETTVPTEPETTVPTEPETTVPTEPETTVPTEPETTVPTEPETTVPVTKFTVAGDFVTPAWDPASNEMNKGEYMYNDVAYDYEFTTSVEAGTWNFKVTNGTWDVCYPANNFSFTTTEEGAVTVYFNSTTFEIAVDSAYLDTAEFEVLSVTAVGNGDGTWLNGANWDPADTTNDMTQIAPGVWEITYTDIDAYDSYEVKFAVNHSWTYNWTIDGIFDGQTNIGQVVEQDGSTVTLRIDLNGFDFKTKEGTVVTAFEVTPPTPATLLGDVDGDGEVTIKDATTLQTYVAKLCAETDLDLTVADVDGDGRVNVVDATYIQLMVAGYEIA